MTRPSTDTELKAARALAMKRFPPKKGNVGLSLKAPQWLKLLEEVRKNGVGDGAGGEHGSRREREVRDESLNPAIGREAGTPHPPPKSPTPKRLEDF